MAFALKVILSFIVGGGFVSSLVWLSEKLGARVGGSLAGIPSTILISLIFICATEGSKVTRSASTIIPMVFLAALFYALVFVYAARSIKNVADKHIAATFIAMAAWFVAAFFIKVLFDQANILITLVIAVAGIIVAHNIFKRFRSAEPKKIQPPIGIYVIRFLAAGTVVAGAVLATRLLGPLWGGVVSGFPASFSTALYFLNKSQGCAFTEGYVKRLPLSILSSVVFIIVLHATLTRMPAVLSFALGLGGSLIYTYFLLAFSKPQLAHAKIEK